MARDSCRLRTRAHVLFSRSVVARDNWYSNASLELYESLNVGAMQLEKRQVTLVKANKSDGLVISIKGWYFVDLAHLSVLN
jgi:hypothetical protein